MSVLDRLGNFMGRTAMDEAYYELVASEIESGDIVTAGRYSEIHAHG